MSLTRCVFSCVVVALATAPGVVRAQDSLPTRPDSALVLSARDSARIAARATAILRAQRAVNDGNGVDGRRVLDSLLNATEPRAPEEAEILFWRATLAESWDQAQRDYLRIMLEHDRSPRAAAAMLRLAQGEMTRGDREAAFGYLERLVREAPDSELRAEAALWQGRLLIERGARVDGCTVLRENRARVRLGALELEHQFDALLRECASVASAPPSSAPPSPTASPTVVGTPANPVTPPPTRPAAPESARPTPRGMVWSVQIAAFQTLGEATAFATEIGARGYDTRVDGTSAPFRVRFGRYADQAAAAAAMESYKTKERSDAFLTRVPRE